MILTKTYKSEAFAPVINNLLFGTVNFQLFLGMKIWILLSSASFRKAIGIQSDGFVLRRVIKILSYGF